VKHFNALANREFLLLVAIAASAITMHVRQHVVTQAPPSHIENGRMCAPSGLQDSDKKARALPADCDMRTNVQTPHMARTWV
jgi:hypothetical protein